MKERLDVILVKQGFAPSREKAKAILMAGNVFVDGQREDKAGTTFDESRIHIEIKGSSLKYVSRGGLKLEKAMTHFGVELQDKICMDVGASTGGFTDCMLQNGAVKVYAVDVGHGQLDWKLRNDERVICMEKTNFRFMMPSDVSESPDFASVDVSFISLTKILLPARAILKEKGEMVCLIKPQFEAGREKVGKKGVVREPEILILDDSASALDFATDARLRRAIKENTGDMTVFLVSQRAATIRNADQILVLDDGKLAGKGTHKELLSSMCIISGNLIFLSFLRRR